MAVSAQETVGAGSPAVNAPGGIAAAAETPKHIVSPNLLVLAVVLATGALAHAPVPARTLRLQLQQGRLEGLLKFHPPAAAARVYAAAPDRAVALVPAALAGLRIDSGGAELHPKVQEARVVAQPGGALDEVILLDVGAAGSSLRISVESGPPLPVELLAGTGVRLQLISGPGAPIRGGLALHPRPGLPCVVTIVAPR
jgi:hypothetical protein